MTLIRLLLLIYCSRTGTVLKISFTTITVIRLLTTILLLLLFILLLILIRLLLIYYSRTDTVYLYHTIYGGGRGGPPPTSKTTRCFKNIFIYIFIYTHIIYASICLWFYQYIGVWHISMYTHTYIY